MSGTESALFDAWRVALAVVLLIAGMGKVRSLNAFASTIEQFGVGRQWSRALAQTIVLSELLTGSWLILGLHSEVAVGAATALLAGLTLALFYGRLRAAITSDCGCFGKETLSLPFSHHVLLNVGFATGGIVFLLTGTAHSGIPVGSGAWFGLTFGAPAAAAALIWQLSAAKRHDLMPHHQSGHERAATLTRRSIIGLGIRAIGAFSLLALLRPATRTSAGDCTDCMFGESLLYCGVLCGGVSCDGRFWHFYYQVCNKQVVYCWSMGEHNHCDHGPCYPCG